MCVLTEYTDTFAVKNTINFFGLVTLCLGKIKAEAEDEVFTEEDRNGYRRLILRNGIVQGILLQGDISHSGIWQYIIKNRIEIGFLKEKIFQITFADFYETAERGKYVWKTDKSRQKADKTLDAMT